jgi:hypothetical protein
MESLMLISCSDTFTGEDVNLIDSRPSAAFTAAGVLDAITTYFDDHGAPTGFRVVAFHVHEATAAAAFILENSDFCVHGAAYAVFDRDFVVNAGAAVLE